MEMLKKTKELLASLVDVTEAGSKIAKHKIEVANLDRKLGLAYKQIGERIYRMNKKESLEVVSDPEITAALKDVAKIRSRMGTIHQEVAGERDKAVAEWDKAAAVVKEEAGRASKAVKVEAGRASKAVKDEAGRASKAVRKEADRASKAVKKEAGRAAAMIKDETSRAKAALKKVSKKKAAPKKTAPAKKAAPKKKAAPVKKAAPKKAAPKRKAAPAKKAAPKKAAPKKAAPKKKAVSKKASLLVEVSAVSVVYDDDGEVFHLQAPDRLGTEVFVRYHLGLHDTL
jgi:hypothetical protein